MLYNVNRSRNDSPKSAADFVLYREETVNEEETRRRFIERQRKR